MGSVNYSIKGKYDNKGVKEALKGFKNLENSVKRINGIIAGFAGLKVIQSIKSISTETKAIFQDQNKALVQFNTAVSKTNLNLSKLQAIQNKVSRNNLFDGDAINNAMQMALTMGLTENQIEKVMAAATDMAASGIMPLDTAVKALSLSYSGNVTQLKKIAPELSNLSDAEIRNGAAVDALAKKYDGFGDSLAGTFSGRNTQWENSISDLKASIGSIPASLEFITQGKLLEPLNKVTEWIIQNRNYIINFFLNLPAIANVAFKAIQDGIKKLFSKEGLTSIVKAITDSMVNVGSTTLNIFAEVIKGLIEMIKAFTTNLESGDVGNLLINAWYKICNQLNEMFFKVFDVAAELIEGNFKDAMAVAMGTKKGKIAGSLHYDYKSVDTTKSIQAVTNVVKEMGKNISGMSGDLVKAQKDVIFDFLDNFQGIGEDAFNEIKDILGKDLPEELQKALDAVTYNGDTSTTKTNTNTNTDDDIKKTLLNSAGQIGTYIKQFQENGFTGIAMQVFTDIMSKLSAQSEIISSVLNIVDYLVEQVAMPLINLLEPVLNPILSVVKSIGTVIGAALPLLQPFFELTAGILTGIAKVIFWFKTLFQSIFDTIYYGYTEMVNWIIKIYNKLNGWGKDLDQKNQNKSWTEIATQWKSLFNSALFEEAFNNSMSYSLTSSGAAASASGGSGASYTAQKDVIVNIHYDHSFINGDAREIAIQIHNEIKSAQRLGLV